MELDKKTVLTIYDNRGLSIQSIEYIGELLDFDNGESISLHNVRGISGEYVITKRDACPHQEIIGFPYSSECLSRNYDLFPAEK